jgi:hypothetical protein
VHVTDAQHKGGDDYAYRLRISLPIPDFELRVVPASVSLRAGSSASVMVYALQKDGFTNDIKLTVKSPEGFSLPSNARIPGMTNQISFILSANPKLSQETFNIVIEGTAKINDKEVFTNCSASTRYDAGVLLSPPCARKGIYSRYYRASSFTTKKIFQRKK